MFPVLGEFVTKETGLCFCEGTSRGKAPANNVQKEIIWISGRPPLSSTQAVNKKENDNFPVFLFLL